MHTWILQARLFEAGRQGYLSPIVLHSNKAEELHRQISSEKINDALATHINNLYIKSWVRSVV